MTGQRRVADLTVADLEALVQRAVQRELGAILQRVGRLGDLTAGPADPALLEEQAAAGAYARLTVGEIITKIGEAPDVATLQALEDLERDGEVRSTVLQCLDMRRDELTREAVAIHG